MAYIFAAIIALIGLFSVFDSPENIEIYMNSKNYDLDFTLSKNKELEASKNSIAIK